MDGKRQMLPFKEVGSCRMRFAPVKDRFSKETKKGSGATTKGGPNKKKKVQNNIEAKIGCLRFRLGETSPEGAIQFCKEVTHTGQDTSWPEISSQARRNESNCRPITAPSLGPPCRTRPNSAASRGNAALSMEQLPVMASKNDKDDSNDFDDNGIDEIDANNADSDDVADGDDDWFDVFVESPTQAAETNAKLYGIELQRLGALVPLNKEYTEFAIPEFNSYWKTVATHKYLIITRKAVRLLTIDGSQTSSWIYCCSCNETQNKFVKNLNFHLLCSKEELAALETACIHTNAVSYICRELDVNHGLLPTEFSTEEEPEEESGEIIELPHDSSRICIRVEGKTGFVGIEMGKLRCMTCKYNSNSCIHIETLRSSTEASLPEIPNVAYDLIEKERVPWQLSSFTLLKPMSHKKIPVRLPKDLASKLAVGYANFVEKRGDILILPNQNDSCQDCGCPLDFDGSELLLPLYTKLSPLTCKVYIKECPACKFIHEYDGGIDGILNMGRFLIGHDILRDYMYHFVFGGSSTLHSYYCAMTRQQIELGFTSFMKDFSYQFWRASWYSFLELLDIPYDNWEICSDCGKIPDVIVCDGTSLGFRKQLLANVTKVTSDDDTIKRHSFHKARLAIEDPGLRSLLESWAKKVKSDKQDEVDIQDQERLAHLLKANYPEICSVFNSAQAKTEFKSLKPLMDFMLCLSSSSPVCAYIPPSAACKELLQKLCSPDVKSKPFIVRDLQHQIPVLYDVLCSIRESAFPPFWKALFDRLYRVSSAPFAVEHLIEGPTLKEAVGHQLAFFPTLFKCRERGSYELDLNNVAKEDDPCTKKSHGHPSLTSGIFTIYCPHGINYGFQVMQSAESPNIPFTIFRTRFQKAPSTIIYDNACNLHAYCLNRDPVFFKSTKFLVDRFHWKNHRGCCTAYNMSTYPAYKETNSQVNEQQNSTLKRLRSQLSYMGPDNFMMHCKFFLWFRNSETVSKFR